MSFWAGVIMVMSFGLLFFFRPDWELYVRVFSEPLNQILALTLSIVPFPVAVTARYLSKT